MLFDTHLHLSGEDDASALFSAARAAGVFGFVLAGTGPDDSAAYAAIAASEPGVFATVGLHPHEAEARGAETGWAREILERCPQSAVAVGEVGLDYYYEHSPKAKQRAVFDAYLELACERDLPVVVHCRDAYEDCLAALRGGGGSLPRILLHSYTGPVRIAEKALELGAFFSFNGIATFRTAENVRSVLRGLPVERILLETDSPYLAPVPHRGKRNCPAWVGCVADALARELETERAELARRTTRNALAFFGLREENLASADPGNSVSTASQTKPPRNDER